jgi:hypothetical protein
MPTAPPPLGDTSITTFSPDLLPIWREYIRNKPAKGYIPDTDRQQFVEWISNPRDTLLVPEDQFKAVRSKRKRVVKDFKL